ncbi:TetR/AcrR family transcriptional regulator [Teichococcus cervicalis]|uniref:Transcriptional regulator, TetR family n=1 Tax=Pseudoroseomonas cervicalis ATCC 49957 TaxID=525371 RepID=D5RRZ4_9PROT|nr:TetR/AcrR family transcriptional regulator [Pseudoroseomonas cervicalis]EFH09920.1 transcriptional regulator, TetR family [Pseudoroseomonas cervicalis ATCC 49957]
MAEAVASARRRRSEMIEETRARLIAAGRRAFALHGYAAASMDELTAEAGLTRGALYHHFGDKKGLLQAVVEQIDAEMSVRLDAVAARGATPWQGFLDQSVAYIEMALEPEIQRIMLRDGPAVLGDPAQWPSQNACLAATTGSLRAMIEDGTLRPVDAEAAARLLNGAALTAALWIAAAEQPEIVLRKAVEGFLLLASGLLRPQADKGGA